MGKVKRTIRREKKEMLSQLKKNDIDVKVIGFDEMTREGVIDLWLMTSRVNVSKEGIYDYLKRFGYKNEEHLIIIVDDRLGYDLNIIDFKEKVIRELGIGLDDRKFLLFQTNFSKDVIEWFGFVGTEYLSDDLLNMVSV